MIAKEGRPDSLEIRSKGYGYDFDRVYEELSLRPNLRSVKEKCTIK